MRIKLKIHKGKLKFIISNTTVGFQRISWWMIAPCILLVSGDRTNVILESFKIIINIFYAYKLYQRFSSIFSKQHCCRVGWKQKELFENFYNEIISSIYAHITNKIFICVFVCVCVCVYIYMYWLSANHYEFSFQLYKLYF